MSVAAETKKPARRTQAERTDRAHRQMIRAATKLIARQGFTKTTLAAVAKEAGYSAGLVSHHFGSKEGLLLQTVSHLAHRFQRDQVNPAVDGASGLESVDAFIELYLEELRRRPGRMKALYVLMGEAIGPVPEIRKVFAEVNEGLRDGIANWIRQGIEEGQIRVDCDPVVEAAMVVALLRGLTTQLFIDRGAIDLEAAGKRLRRLVHESLHVQS